MPQRTQAAFIVLVGAALIATLSRSTLLVAATILAFAAIRRPYLRAGVKRFVLSRDVRIAAGTLVIWIFGAALLNPVFGSGSSSIINRTGQLPFAVQSFASSLGNIAGSASQNQLQALTEQIEPVERVDNSAARALYLGRDISAYLNGPSGGIGLERAYALSPRNSCILCGIAFSTLGFAISVIIFLLNHCILDRILP